MIYYSDYDLVLLDILKNGSNLLKQLFEYTFERKADRPYFLREPQIFIVVCRNPYDRLVSQFYHINAKELRNNYRYAIHYPFFRKWVKETYGMGYDGNDGHYYSQSHIIQYDKFPELPYSIFKMEELIPHQLFWYMDLTDEKKSQIDEQFLEITNELVKTHHHSMGNSKQGLWKTFYDSETIEVCNQYFADDFRIFGYDMIDPLKWETPKRSVL